MSEEVAQQPKTLDGSIKALESGNLKAIDDLIEAHLAESNSEQKYLKIIANAILKYAQPVEWVNFSSSIEMFASASIEDYESLKIVAPLFERADMLEFTKAYFTTVAKVIINSPERIVDILLFISSRAVQSTPQFYSYAVPALYSSIVSNLKCINFENFIPCFMKFVDFEPEATTPPLQQIMADRFKVFMTSLEHRNVDQTTDYANETFLNLMKFLKPFAYRYEQYRNAFLILAVRSLHEDPSLTLNPFRIKMIQILIDSEHYLECVAPLAKILSKSLQEKKNQDVMFDWDQLLVANKEIARNEGYQELLFGKALKLLRLCLDKLKDRIAYPEIVAPVVRTIKIMIENQIFKEKEAILKDLLKSIDKVAKKVTETRQKVAGQPGFKVIEHREI